MLRQVRSVPVAASWTTAPGSSFCQQSVNIKSIGCVYGVNVRHKGLSASDHTNPMKLGPHRQYSSPMFDKRDC
eukprot:scaffold190811_cov48-Prasinocladus_malaysianus.AAC.2